MSLADTLVRVAFPVVEPEVPAREWNSASRMKSLGGPALAGMTSDEFWAYVRSVEEAGLPILSFDHTWPTPQK